MVVAVDNASLAALQIGRLKDAGTAGAGTGVATASWPTCAPRLEVARSARTMLGGAGITLDHSVMRHMNNLETVMTYEGTEEMHTLSIGAASPASRPSDDRAHSSPAGPPWSALVTGASKGSAQRQRGACRRKATASPSSAVTGLRSTEWERPSMPVPRSSSRPM